MITEFLYFFPALLVALWMLGFKMGRGHAQRPIQKIELGPNICQCEHPISFHRLRSKDCNAKTGSGHNCRCEVYTSPFYIGEDP